MNRFRSMLSVVTLFLLVVIVGATSSANANTNLNGVTGLVAIPDAHSIAFKDITLGGAAGTRAKTGKTAYSYSAQLGAFKGLEVGFIGGSNEEGNFREGVFINLKYSLTSGEERNPLRIALGTENLTSSTNTDVYMVFSKMIKDRIELTGGFLADFSKNRFRPLGLLGINIPILTTLNVMADGLIGESMAQGNAGVSLTLHPDFALRALAINVFNNADARGEQAIYYGFSWKNPF